MFTYTLATDDLTITYTVHNIFYHNDYITAYHIRQLTLNKLFREILNS